MEVQDNRMTIDLHYKTMSRPSYQSRIVTRQYFYRL